MNTEYRPPHWSQFLGINFRKLALYALVGVALAFGGWKGWHYLAATKRARLATLTQEFLKQGDLRSAVLTARQILKERPQDLAALKVMAEVADRTGSPAAALWWERVVQVEPSRMDNHLNWAASALRAGQVQSASLALSRLPEFARQTARYHELAGAIALTASQLPAAEKHFAEAVRLDPTNAAQQVNLAVVRLQLPDPGVVAEARRTLRQLESDETQRVRALRTLVADSKRRGNAAEALAFSRSLMRDAQAGFTDALHHLSLLHVVKDPDFASALDRLQKQAARQTPDVSQLATWMNQNGLAKEALSWMRSLPPAIRDTMPVPLAAAESHVQLRSWPELNTWLQTEDWEELDFLRLAFLARALRESDQADRYRAAWNQAITAVGQDAQKQSMLARVADGWRWTAEAEQLWWMIAMSNLNQRPALAALNRLYTQRKDERMLLRVAARAYNLAESDLIAKNNYALLSALLGDNRSQAFRMAKENYELHRDNSAFRSTYAFTLYQQGKVREALELLSSIPLNRLEQPSLAAYYGIVLAASGQAEEARRYLELAGKSDTLLPAEKRLVDQAMASLK